MGDSSTAMTVSGRSEVNLAFAINDSDFSDRILHLEIIPDDHPANGEHSDSGNKLKAEKYDDWFSSIQRKSPFFYKVTSLHICSLCSLVLARLQGYKVTGSKSRDGAKVTSLHICSLVLAGKSPFFYKMFKNGMKESQQKSEICLKIKASEEATLMNLLRFMYGETTLNATSFNDLVDLLIAADKFEVTSCMSYCVEMLHKFPMSQESALFYLELPSSVLVSEIVKPLIDAAKQFVVALYKDFTKSQDEAMQLPVSAIEVVLGSEGLQVVSEDDVFDFVLKWGRASYPELEVRREVLTNRLTPLICFPNMSVQKLKEVLGCADFDNEHLSKIVMEALFSKVERSSVHLIRDSVDLSTTQCNSVGRVYIPCCVIFFDIKKGECASLYPMQNLDSPQFCLGGKRIYLLARCGAEKDRFGLFVMRKPDSEPCTIDFDLSVLKKSSMEFESKCKTYNETLGINGKGRLDLLGITWTEFMSDDSDYFIDGVLHMRAEITLKG